MSSTGWAQLAVAVVVLAVLAPLLGRYLAAVFGPGPAPGDRFFARLERPVFRLLGIDPSNGQPWFNYARSVIAFGAVSVAGLYALLRIQAVLPFDPTGAPAIPSSLAFNTAISFVTGTNWQAYAGENTMSHLSQMAGLVVAQFTAAAVGMSVALALVRGIVQNRRRHGGAPPDEGLLGNFWADLTRSIVRVLMPIAIVATLFLVSQGAVQNLRGNTVATTVEGASQVIPGGPVATQEALKTLGTNGGGFYNAGSAHPLANPNGLTNVFELVLALAIPFAFPFMYGRLAGRPREGYTIVAVMAVLWIAPVLVASFAEGNGNPRLAGIGVDQAAGSPQSGGNLEGKEVRFGPAGSSLLSVGTMGTSAGVTPAALDSLTSAGGASALVPILLGEISPGGVGSGLYGMLIYVMVAVFIGGLMVGRTPEYLGQKLQAAEMRLIALYVLVLPIVVLVGTGASVLLPSAVRSALNSGQHGFTEVLYAFASAANGNGSAFAGLDANTDWYNTVLGLVMLAGRFLPIVIVLALAGSLSRKEFYAPSVGTMPTTGWTFGGLLLGVLLVLGGLTYLPALVLGPIAEHLAG
jgi:K+-transporting ATPase ATPase A chain